ncbi:MAG: hypothetical protein R2726_02555 [Acidimicrobiales bacterium]
MQPHEPYVRTTAQPVVRRPKHPARRARRAAGWIAATSTLGLAGWLAVTTAAPASDALDSSAPPSTVTSTPKPSPSTTAPSRSGRSSGSSSGRSYGSGSGAYGSGSGSYGGDSGSSSVSPSSPSAQAPAVRPRTRSRAS